MIYSQKGFYYFSLKMLNENQKLQEFNLPMPDTGSRYSYKKIVSQANQLLETYKVKINEKGYLISSGELELHGHKFIEEINELSNFFIEPLWFMECCNANNKISYKLFAEAYCFEKNKYAYIIINENDIEGKWISCLPKDFKIYSKEAKDKVLKHLKWMIDEKSILKRESIQYYLGTGWHLCNGLWFYPLLDFKSQDTLLNPEKYEGLLGLLNNKTIKTLLSFYILAINYDFIRKGNNRNLFVLNIYGSHIAKIERLISWIYLPYKNKARFIYQFDNPSIRKRNDIFNKNKDNVIVANINDIAAESPAYLNKLLSENLNTLFYQIYYSSEENFDYSVNSLITIISNKKIYYKRCLNIDGDEISDSTLRTLKNIRIEEVIKEYIQYLIEKVLNRKKKEKSKSYISKIANKFQEIFEDLDTKLEYFREADIEKATFLLLGHYMFIDYLSKKNIISNAQKDQMFADYKEQLIAEFLEQSESIGNIANKRQTERFIKQIYDIYLNNREMFVERTSIIKNDKYLGFFGKIRGESRLIFRKKDVIDRFNDISNLPFKLSLTPDELYSELKDIGVLFNYDTNRGFTYLKLQKEKQETEVIQIVLEKLENYLKNK